ncbi:hypothetical protein [Soonwooa sp.]|uniref:hypothetical protein n=1 Tax=Soonwooa sp. TaxID=1938592 RepID=UPI002636C9E6|nr:hypothetical protein [Soonwooa sp.]
MKKILLLFAILPFFITCNGQGKTDLLKLNLNEPVETLISENENTNKFIGTESMEYPFAILVGDADANNFSISDVPIKKVYFLLSSKVDYHNANSEGQIFKTKKQLLNNLNELKKKNIDNKIFGFRAVISDGKSKAEIKKLLISKYGKGTKNPNNDNGLYWNIKSENKYIFFAPDYDRLIVLNNADLSKTCYWDNMNGMIKFGNADCDTETYFKEMGAYNE